MDPDTRRFLYVIVLAGLTLGSSFLFLGWPWARASTRSATGMHSSRPYAHGWYYRRYGGGHGGWVGRGFNWGTFGGLGSGGDLFRGGGPGFGK
jgi:hypothetical protein